MDSNIKHLYDTMISRGYTGLGDFSNFEGKMKDSGKRKLVYDHLMQDDYFSEIGDFSKFESALGYSPAKKDSMFDNDSFETGENEGPKDSYLKDLGESFMQGVGSLGKIALSPFKKAADYINESDVGKAINDRLELEGGQFGQWYDSADKMEKEYAKRSDRYGGKDFVQLLKDGRYADALGEVFLSATKSAPTSLGVMAASALGSPAAGLAALGAGTASEKYDQLGEENPDMGSGAKMVNSLFTGLFEAGTEYLGAGAAGTAIRQLLKSAGREAAGDAIKKSLMQKSADFMKKHYIVGPIAEEAMEETVNALGEYITDELTGVDRKDNIVETMLKSGVYGAAGGAQYSPIIAGARLVGNKLSKNNVQNAPSQLNGQINMPESDQGVNTTPQFTKSIIDDAFEQGRNMSDKGDLRDLSLQMEASRTALTEKNPNLAIRMEQYIDNGASENQINEMLKGVDNETRELAYDFYINTQKIKGVEDKSIENINNEVDSYMSDNIIPYVSISPNGRQVISTATFKEGLENKKVYIRSINGDNVIISDNGNNRMVPMSSLSDIEENDVEQIRNSYRQQLLVTRQSELDMAMNHNPKTQLPKPGLVIWNGDNAFILQGQDENGDWIAQPAALDKETGQVAPKAGSAPAMPITERDILALQDAMYDAQQANEVSPEDDNVASADAEITSAPPVEDAINQPTSEIETEGAIDQIAQPSNVENPSMVMREDGTPDFVSSGTDMALDFLYDKYGDKMPRKIEVTRKSFDESLKKASDALEKAQEAYDDAPIGKEDKVEAALIKARQEYDAIKVEADFWANLDNRLKEESEKATATSGQVIDISEKEDTEPVDIKNEDVVTQEGASGEVKESGSNLFNYFTGSLSELIEQAKKSAGKLIKKIVAPVSDRLRNDLEIKGVSITSDYNHVIDNNAIRHTLKQHGGNSEIKRGQVPVNDSDFDKISDIVENYDDIKVEDGKRGDVNIIYSKTFNDGTTIFVEEKRDKRKELAAVTMWKMKNPILTGANSDNATPIPDLNRIKRQAEREGGELLILTPKGAAASLSTLPDNSSSTDKGSISSSENQANEVKSFVAPSPKESENPLDYAERIVEAKRLHDEELKVDTTPSEAQKEAGNYKKGHIKINGFDVTIEQPAGSVRSGKDASGKEWSQVMNNTYGYIRGTKGVDGDHIDVFLGPDMNSDMVYVVDQVNTDGSFDEHKVMMGFSSLEDARSAYLSNYEEGWQGLGNITGVALDGFKKWIDSSTRKTKPFSEYKGIKREESDTSQDNDSDNKPYEINRDIREKVWKIVSFLNKKYGYNFESEISFVKWISKKKKNRSWLIDKIGEDNIKEAYEAIESFIKEYNKIGRDTRPDSGIRFRETRIIPEEENIIKKAKSDGSYMKAPNGNPTNLNEKQWVQVRTKAFKEWFGDWENDPENASKVIDENGEPRVVYHGTDSDFNAFDESHLGEVTDLNATNEDWAKTSHIGFWFNDNKIGFYTKHKPVYLNVRNPLEFASMESLVDEMSYYDSGEDFKRSNSDGYDSVIVLEDEEMGGRSYVVFNDNQIKSATENNEDFSFHNDETSKNEAVKQASEIDGAHFRSIGDKDTDNLNNAETIESSINDWSTKFNTPVKVIHDVDDIIDTDENMLARKRDSKGWYDTSTGEIVIVSPNSTSVGDAQKTFLHEVVGHHGLRELFRDDFDTFLDNVYRNANEDIRKNIIDRTKGNPLNLREATEEYLAELAERGFDNKAERSLWEKIKDAFIDMLRKAGISLDFKLSDNDLRYILWRSYKNLEQGNLMDVAEDTVMRNDLGIGDFSVRFREAKTEVENEEPLNKEMVDAWDKVASSDSFKFKEAMVDSLTAIDEFLKLLAKKTKSKILDYENPYYALIALSSKNKADMDSFDSKFLNPLNEAIRALIGDVSEVSKKGLRRTWDWSKGPLRDLVKYVQSKHGIERNRDMSVRDGIETLKAFDVDALSKMGVISDSDLKNAKKTAEKVAEEKGSEAYKKTYDKVLGKELKKGVDKGKAERSAEIAADYRKSFVKSDIYNKEMDKYKEKVTGALIDRWEDSKKDVLNKDLAWDEEQKELDREALSFQWKLGDNSYGVILGKDYSGLSSVFKSSEDGANKDKWLSDAYDFVRDYESTHNMVLVDNLWDKVHNVSEYTLRRQYESGLISKSYMDKNLSRFKYFIPLRGFSDNIASDVYDYIDATEIKMGNPVKTAKGRISEADNPFAGLIHVGYGSITAGNRNLAKQRFLNLASNHDTGGLITIDNIWVRNVGTEENPEWVESVPQIPDNASGEEVAKAVKDHEEMMRELREEGKAELIKGGRSDIPYKTLYDQRSQHQVQVFVGGNRYVMTVNGNPRLAQAVNGLTNPDVKDDLAYVVARNLKTFMAGAFTSKNVAFSFANLIRDTPYANNSVFVTENFRYFKDFSGNQRRALFGLRSLGRNLYKYRRGEIDISDKEQAIFKEFMDNGGATGYTFVETQKEYAKDLANKLEKLSDGNIGKLSPKELVSTVFECFEFMGNVAELVNRYAAYKTSREHGRSIDRSINDAKEVSVNFNKKGAGKKTKSDKWYINTAAWISEYGRDWVLFFNAAVQSMYKEYSMLINHPIKGIGSRIAPLIFMGSSVSLLNNMFMPMLFAYLGWDSDDDDRDYFDSLSDHERQNNICIRLTHGRWLKIPLSPELANYFKIGDIIAGQLSGKREVEAMDVVKTGIDMVSPLNINWEYDSWKFALNLLPTVVQPIAQNASNVNFMGNPIYKTSMNKANDYDPEYTKVYRSTSTTMVELSRALNSLTGGDDVKRGLSFNPATWQNIFSGYTGGFGTVALGVSDLVLDILSGEDGDMPVSRYPLLSRFLTGGDKDLKLSRVNSIYNKKVVDFVTEMDHDYKGYLEKSMDPSINILDRAEYIVKLEKFMKSDDFKKSQELSQYVRAISDMERFLREVGSDNDSLENQVYELKLQALEIFEDE